MNPFPYLLGCVSLLAINCSHVQPVEQTASLVRCCSQQIIESQHLTFPDKPAEKLADGFSVSNEVILLRAQMLELDTNSALDAMNRLGRTAMDRVTVEMLRSMTRASDEARRLAAGQALIEIGQRAAKLGHRQFAGSIGEHLYLSAQSDRVRDQAYELFMLLDTASAQRHRLDH